MSHHCFHISSSEWENINTLIWVLLEYVDFMIFSVFMRHAKKHFEMHFMYESCYMNKVIIIIIIIIIKQNYPVVYIKIQTYWSLQL